MVLGQGTHTLNTYSNHEDFLLFDSPLPPPPTQVTTSGQFVFPLDSHHKKPYEVLVLGRYRSTADNPTSSSGTSEVPVEDQRLIVSVPSALHSQKPSLSEVLKPHVAAGAECLELFARSLQPGWTSWGNEVLKFQHVSYFTLTPAADPDDEPAVTPGSTSSPGESSPPTAVSNSRPSKHLS